MSAKQYTLIFIPLLFALLGLSALFNRVVDPFWYYRDISVAGFNSIKPKFGGHERLVKPAIVQREQPASLVFGSSYAEIGFDPQHPALRGAGTSYNFALAGAEWNLVSCSVLFALSRDNSLHQIVLGIHPDGMPLTDCKDELDKMEHPNERDFLWTLDALEASIATVQEQRWQKPSHTAEGLYFYTRGLPGTIWKFRQEFSQTPICKNILYAEQPATDASPPGTGQTLNLEGLRDILHKATARGIVVKLVVYPRHALSTEEQYQCGTRQSKWDALRQIAAMAQQEANGLAEVWNFDGYNEFCTETIGDNAARYWQDPGHFNYEFGNVMLDEMFGLKPAKIGMRLTSANIDLRARQEMQERINYLHGHPEFVQQFKELVQNK